MQADMASSSYGIVPSSSLFRTTKTIWYGSPSFSVAQLPCLRNLSLNAVTNFECSLTQLNYSQETSDALSSSLNSVFGRVKASSLILHTSFMQITAYFAQQEVQNLRGPLDKETEHLLKVLSMALMKALYLLGARGVFDVEFRRRWALPSWRR